MTHHDLDTVESDEQGGFIARWSKLKQTSQEQNGSHVIATETSETPEPQILLCDEDMPPIDSLTEESDYTGFFSEKVSEALRQQALRKLFHSASFNVCDGLDDYADDFTNFAKLGSIITSDMRHQIEVAKEKLEAALEAVSADKASAETVHQQDEDVNAPVSVEVPEDELAEAPPLLAENNDDQKVKHVMPAEQQETAGSDPQYGLEDRAET